MPMNLKDVEDYDRKDWLRVEHIYWAITYEAKKLKNWDNALTLLTHYLAPVIIASEKASAAAANAAATAGDNNTDNTAKNSATGQKAATAENTSPSSSFSRSTDIVGPASTTSKFSEFVEDETTGQYTKQLSKEDIRQIQWSICALVRYAPSPSESNVVYMFYLQRQPPVRNDETIDNCLVSLIYQYAQVKNDPELQAKGLDLIKVALDRGVGLPSYQSKTSKNHQQQYYNRKPESILASVSKAILIKQNLQITADGRSLEARRPGPPGRFNTPQKQQQQQGVQPLPRGSGAAAGAPRPGQSQGPAPGQGQGAAVVSGRKPGRPTPAVAVAARSSSPQPQQQPQQQQVPQQQKLQQPQFQQSQEKSPKPRHRKQDSAATTTSTTRSNKGYNTTAQLEEATMDQYDYYTKASQPFAGTERVKPGSRSAFGGVGSGTGGGKLRTIAFVPASVNAMLNVDHHPATPSTEEGDVTKKAAAEEEVVEESDSKDDVTAVLAERVENLRLDHTSE